MAKSNDKEKDIKWLDNWKVIGSDEIGNGEVFKPIIVTAAYVRPEDIARLDELGVNDSKKISKKIDKIGPELTGFKSFEDFEKRQGTVIRDGVVPYCVYIITNKEYNELHGKEGNLHDLMRDRHSKALHALMGFAEYNYVVVDDFQNGLHHDEITRLLGMREIPEKEVELEPEWEGIQKAVIQIRADGKVKAVSCASDISAYVGNLYLDELNAKIKKEYGITHDLHKGANHTTPEFQAPLRELKEKGDDVYEKFLNIYAKRQYLRNMKLDDSEFVCG